MEIFTSSPPILIIPFSLTTLSLSILYQLSSSLSPPPFSILSFLNFLLNSFLFSEIITLISILSDLHTFTSLINLLTFLFIILNLNLILIKNTIFHLYKIIVISQLYLLFNNLTKPHI